MDDKTKTALLGSIEKWQKIVDGTGEDMGTFNCPLCQLFYVQKNDCQGCPVSEKTGFVGCAESPYIAFSRLDRDSLAEPDKMEPEIQRQRIDAAKAELEFLKSLLPE